MPKERKLHWYAEGMTNSTLCGRAGQVADDKDGVTCMRCQAKLKQMVIDLEDSYDEEDEAEESIEEKSIGENRWGLLDYAVDAISASGEPMRCKDIAEYAKANGWEGNGKTPANTLNAAINKEIQVKGSESRFKRAGRGLYDITS